MFLYTVILIVFGILIFIRLVLVLEHTGKATYFEVYLKTQE